MLWYDENIVVVYNNAVWLRTIGDKRENNNNTNYVIGTKTIMLLDGRIMYDKNIFVV
jgi:hypothetical protein